MPRTISPPHSPLPLIYFTRSHPSFRLPAACFRLSSAIRSSPHIQVSIYALTSPPHTRSKRPILLGKELLTGTNTSLPDPLFRHFFCRQCVLDLRASNKRAPYPHTSLATLSLLTSITVFPPSGSHFGWEGPSFRRTRHTFHSLAPLPKLHVLVCDHSSGHIVVFKSPCPDATHQFTVSHGRSPISLLDLDYVFSLSGSLLPHTCSASPARDYANVSLGSNLLTTYTSLNLRSYMC